MGAAGPPHVAKVAAHEVVGVRRGRAGGGGVHSQRTSDEGGWDGRSAHSTVSRCPAEGRRGPRGPGMLAQRHCGVGAGEGPGATP
mmetsp:Transcript_35841/g.103082  ORF Transcript_35841/g.103082 Transcript_35841/m.103082 type:complete len:85 (-) Transcript_35841:65-319(-)